MNYQLRSAEINIGNRKESKMWAIINSNKMLLVWGGGGLVTKSCLTVSDPMACSLPGSSVHANLQESVLEWVAFSFFRDLPDSGIEPASLGSPALLADSLPTDPPGKL